MKALAQRGGSLEWAFVFGLAIPLIVLDLVLRAIRVVERGANISVMRWIDVFKSDVFFLMGFVALGLTLLYAMRRWKLSYAAFALVQFLAVVVALTEVVSFNFFMRTGSTLDFQLIYFTLSQLMMTYDVVASEIPTYIWWLMASCGSLGLVLPWGFAFGWSKWVRPRVEAPEPERLTNPKLAKWAAISLMAFVVAMQKPIEEQNTAFARNATLTVGVSAGWSIRELLDESNVMVTDTTQAVLVPHGLGAKKRNVVVILLESTRARSVSLYNPELETTPNLVELAKSSLVAENAYAVVPHTSKALVSVLCGIEPRLHVPITEATADGIPGKCLPKLLSEVGYRTAFFQSATQRFENRKQLTDNMGYDTFSPLEKMSKKGFAKVNYFGNEDDIMLKPSAKWLDEVGDEPFQLTYLTLTPHHNYLAPPRYGRHDFDKDKELNRYLNSVHYVDAFVNNVIEMFKKKGLYKDTIFVVVGDHGEGFGEHGRRQHDNVIWNEGIRVPLLIHDPQRFKQGKRIKHNVNQLDIVPTVADLLGFEIRDATFPGMSMLKVDKERMLRAHCWYERRCMASILGSKKYIYHFDERPDEYFDLAKDPHEEKSVLEDIEDSEKRRSDLIAWRGKVNARYRQHAEGQLKKYVTDEHPVLEHPLEAAEFGDFVRLIGVEYSRSEELKPGSNASVTFVFEVLKKPPVEWKLFLHGESKGTKLKNLDHPPVEGLYPLEDWEPGNFIRDNVRFKIPAGARDEYTLWLGFYHPKDGRAEVRGIETDGDRRAKAATLKLAPKPKKTPPKKQPGNLKPGKLTPGNLKPTIQPRKVPKITVPKK